MITCAACGSENRAGSKFCNECGTPLEAVVAPEERRVCTIVFCDLVGFTQRSESLDPEDVRQFLLPYYDLMTEEVERHGGAIDKLYGDGAMAVFGVPSAHEDDPERAIRASLRVLERLPSLGLDLEARIGVNTGEVVVASDHAQRGDALTGDTVNTASRIQSAAPVGAVVVGEPTYTATTHIFDYDVLDPVELKGKAEPVPIFRPLAPIATVVTGGAEATPFVGREQALASLTDAFGRARSGTPTFLTIVAEPGIGKSRLVREFARYVDDLPDLVTWRQGRCLPYGEGISFWALGEIVKTHAGVLDTDDQQEISAKLDTVLTEPDQGTRAWIKDRLAPLVGLETTTTAPERSELFAAWRRFIAQIASPDPLVLVIEDLHWADDILVEFLRDLRASMTDLPVLVLVTARPEVAERHPGWLDDNELRLRALDATSMRELVGASLAGASAAYVEAVCERAAGSPLYAEQLAAMRRTMPIAGSSEDDLPIPPTIQALLAARIDQLTPELHDTLLDASVVGKTFWIGALAALGSVAPATIRDRLAELETREFVRAEPTSTIEGETEFAFVHALLRDVAHGRLSRRPRFDKHRATATWITSHVGRPLGDIAEIVIAHLDEAKDAAEAAGLTEQLPALDSDLVDALYDASAHAARTDAATAVRLAERAVALVPTGDERRPFILFQTAKALSSAGDVTREAELLEEAVPALRELGDWDELGDALAQLVGALQSTGHEARSAELLDAAEKEMGSRAGVGLVNLLLERAFRQWAAGSVDAALASLDRVDALLASAGRDPHSRSLAIRGEALLSKGEVTEGAELVLRAADQASADGDSELAANILNDLGSTTMWHGTYARSLEILDRAVEIGAERGLNRLIGQSPRMRALYHTGRWDEVLREAPPLIEWATAVGNEWFGEGIRGSLTRVLLDRGGTYLDQIDRAAFDPSAFSYRGDYTSWAIAIELQRVSGEVDLGPLAAEWSDGYFRILSPVLVEVLLRAGAIELAERMVAAADLSDVPFRRVTEAQNDGLIAVARGDGDAGERLLSIALEDAREHGSRVMQAMLNYQLGRCAILRGEPDLARQRLAESRELWTSMGADARIEEVDAALASI